MAAVDLRMEGLEETSRLSLGGRPTVDPRGRHHRPGRDRGPARAGRGQARRGRRADQQRRHHPALHHRGALDLATIQRVLDVNLMGTIHLVKIFFPTLRKRPEAHIANVSSMGGFLPVPGQVMYGASKGRGEAADRGPLRRLLDTEVGVSVIMPGAMATNIAGNSGVTIAGADTAAANSRMTSASDAARIIVEGIEAGRSAHLRGPGLAADERRHAHRPPGGHEDDPEADEAPHAAGSDVAGADPGSLRLPCQAAHGSARERHGQEEDDRVTHQRPAPRLPPTARPSPASRTVSCGAGRPPPTRSRAPTTRAARACRSRT